MAISNYQILDLRLFVDFLKKEGCYQAYKDNISKQHTRWENMWILYASEYLRRSFLWEKTPQGYEYWKKIDLKWRKYFKQYAKKVKKYLRPIRNLCGVSTKKRISYSIQT